MQHLEMLKQLTETLNERDLLHSFYNELFELFFSQSPIVAFLKEKKGKMLFINREFEKRFETTNEKIRGKDDYDLWPLEVADNLRKHDLQVQDERKILQLIEYVPTPEGGLRKWLVYKFPVISDDDIFVGGIAIDLLNIPKNGTVDE